MNKSVMYFFLFFQAILPIYSSDSCVLSYNNVKDEHKIHIEEGVRAIFSDQLITGSVKPLLGGISGDGLYLFELNQVGEFKGVFRCMKQPHSIELCQKDCMYAEMAAKQGLGPKIFYQNIEKGCYVTEFVEGVHLSSACLEDQQILEQFADALHAIHNGSIDSPVKFDIFERIELKIKSALQKNPEFSLELNTSLNEVHKIKRAVGKHKVAPKTCHNDIHSMNLFYTHEGTINFIDWGNAGLGDPFWDLVCSSIKLHFSKDQRDFFLNQYFENKATSIDRAHFFLMENIVLWEVWLYYLAMKQETANETVKGNVFNYFRKINEKIEKPINTFQDLAEICFDLIHKRMQSQEYKQALSIFQ